ncbi:ferrochelatase [Arcticibacterium luteifluviistationis]|uniref:Ferrochelatase n=1 Tax=Arcticibacterium luteifluviistationis TaxID=1784714 RepID=A0A2Z4G9F9_9BACT|nr:ferrochelatase [Arcticibacterium luteifluviistationis]AWV97857.1 ferrochelatase [Arcticibacterium luteifluviistationis]
MSKNAKTGVFLVNLGTPDSPSTPDVRKYLREFLMDGRVIDIPYIQRWMLINFIIAPFRSPKSAKIYKELWTEEGSPLKIYGEANEKQLQELLGKEYIVKLGMRYQNPSMEKGLLELRKAGVKKIIVIPLFPQYASASTGSVYEEVSRILSTWQSIPDLKIVSNFYHKDKFINSFVENAAVLQKERKYDHVLFSYHGVPERQVLKGDDDGDCCQLGACCNKITPKNQLCYRAQCFETTRLMVDAMGLKEGEYTLSFQSRLGRSEWVKPYTDHVVKELAEKGVKNILAFSPAFVADCLETTIEVADEFKELFIEHGGEHLQLVPSLNDKASWIELLKELTLEA